ncbi:unnamed protein product [Ilex paraguariensis]|uniref:Reverse transcriptase zinc-binding domain-containing protein n=1 Tax=Ilex paraguariensis TaxID=185542 RepID=A0ABC8UEM5_9AQUA
MMVLEILVLGFELEAIVYVTIHIVVHVNKRAVVSLLVFNCLVTCSQQHFSCHLFGFKRLFLLLGALDCAFLHVFQASYVSLRLLLAFLVSWFAVLIRMHCSRVLATAVDLLSPVYYSTAKGFPTDFSTPSAGLLAVHFDWVLSGRLLLALCFLLGVGCNGCNIQLVPVEETDAHIFVLCPFAHSFCSKLAAAMGFKIVPGEFPICRFMRMCRCFKGFSLSHALIRGVSMFTFWALWKERCRRRFEGLNLNSHAVFLQVVNALK